MAALFVTDNIVVAVDDRLRVVYWNARAEQIYGWTFVDTMGADLVDLVIPATEHAQARERLQTFMAMRQPGRGLSTVRTRHGEELLVAFTIAPLVEEPEGLLHPRRPRRQPTRILGDLSADAQVWCPAADE